ncbi:MAG TPA: guanylate kinase [Dehalococcoidia bacterium]|nr:guanylate kinase [Dehalococcoidia bacterium]
MKEDNPNWTLCAPPLLVVISGPSGVGKDATLSRMRKVGLPFYYVVTATTRPKRPGENDGVDYFFLSDDEFCRMVEKKQFLEWAKVYGNYYGVPRSEVEKALKQGRDAIVKVDVQGAATIKRILPDAIFIFLMPPSMDELANRLRQRYNSPSAEFDLRLGKAEEEMESLPIFDYVVVSHSNKLDLTVSQINAIVTAEKCRLKPRIVKL